MRFGALAMLGILALMRPQESPPSSDGRGVIEHAKRAGSSHDQAIRISDLAETPRGISRAEVIERIGWAPRHELTCKSRESVVECGSYRFGDSFAGYVFVFIDDKLVRIVERPPLKRSTEVLDDGSKRIRVVTEDPLAHFGRIMDATDLDAKSFGASLRHNLEVSDEGRSKGSSLPPDVVNGLAALREHLAPIAERQLVANDELLARFDGWRITLGMPRDEADRILGQGRDLSKEKDSENPKRILYDPCVKLDLVDKRVVVSPILVEFENGLAARVLSDEFLPVIDE